MAKAEASVEELVAMIERGDLRLPEMQRQYVWRSTRVRDLLDSLYRGYPSGAILLWETDEEVPERKFSVSQGKTPYKSTRLLLDGQQRLTSLSAVIRGEPVTVRGRQKPIELLFNLEHPDRLAFVMEVNEDEEDEDEDDGIIQLKDVDDSTEDELQKRINQMLFVVATKKIAALPQWVKVSDVFRADSDAEFLLAAGVQGFDDPRYKKYSERLAKLRAIRKYAYRMDVLGRDLSYDEVTEIFVRVNSLGAKLRSSDLALAQITARWRNSLELFLKFQQSCKGHGFDLDLGLHLRNLMVFASGQSRFLTVGRYDAAALQLAWKECCKGMEYAMNFLRSNVGIDSPALLASPFLMIVVAYFGHVRKYKVGVKESKQLRYWVLAANAKGRFSRGSSETLLDQDIATLRDGGKVDELVDRLRLQVGRLDITSGELEGRNQRSALFKTMFLAFRASGAKDWLSDLAIEIDHTGAQHRLQFHHIFPKVQLKNHYSVREVDDIANLAFIGGKTNRVILDKPPVKYLPSLIEQRGKSTFEAQSIPLKANLLEIESYRDFLSARRTKIAATLNAFLDGEL
ncbi:DUF262 domain-containing protein [Paraburkholderia sabiae]|uniref:DUF262 domain-containing protein n=1 Tax=Paraburkholderia sabiae TaxID=273251 RepID=A0ABU9QMF7_9BURK|nr:DUF262 domain-containing protein [Paraburkholderia sabiae]WJZ79127.1 DUF262 domain-containing protein [Paraburkholderia sabiae]CAD6514375.1 hypothetical protein LMG24235_00904 [Paraburkholderia sabiae]